MKRQSLSLLLNTFVALTIPMRLCSADTGPRPNVILIVADDYGWKDVGCYGSDFYLTPNIDKLAADGMRFTQAYSACTVCSPSRAALLTGKYPARLHVTDWIPGQMPDNPKLIVPDWTKQLGLEEVTLARKLHDSGYATASMGKWHLGGEEYYPEKHGFDVNIAGSHRAEPRTYLAPYGIPTLQEGPPGEYLTDRLGDEALRFIESHTTQPFLLYLPHFAVHIPQHAKKELIEKHRARLRPGLTQTNEVYAAMIESLDDTIGRVRAKLQQLGLAERTIIIFTSDNGARIPNSNNAPLRAGKGSAYEGGTRVPFIVHWSGVTKPGTICETPTIGTDIFPTVLEMTGVAAANSAATTDGLSLVPLLKQSGQLNRDAIFWHYPHYQHYQQGGATPYGAIRAGDFKLIEFFDDMRVELYNLREDIGEQHNLAPQMPDKANELRDVLHVWRNEVGAQMPTRNPAYDPSRPEATPKNQSTSATLTPLAQKVSPAVADKQDFAPPDRVRLSGWMGSRIDANESNRLVKIDTNRLLEGYRKRPGRQIWDGEHVGKWLHAATLAWANTGDFALRQKLDTTVAELVKCQLTDGYLGTYIDAKRWTEWDVWAHKYNLIGLITYMNYTDNMDPLPTCRRMADLLCNTFGDEPGKRDIIPAGHHMGMAPTSVLEPMVLLYRLTGEPRYLDFCKYILRAWEQPNGPKIISRLLAGEPVYKIGNAKAYEMLSCLNGALEYYRTVNDAQILKACLNAWQDIVDHRLYPTGAASYREFFRVDNDFPNLNNVGETCVTVTWLQFNAQLLRLTGEARFAEQLERVVLNQLFGAQRPDGAAWGYYVQMEGRKPYSNVLDGHCCLSSGPRGIALIPTFAVTTDGDGVVVNLYDAGRARLSLHDGTTVTLITDTMYPSQSEVRMKLQGFNKKTFALKLRVPQWCRVFSVEVNGQPITREGPSDGYFPIQREWMKGDEVRMVLHQEPRVLVGTHKNENKAAVMVGPLVLAADEVLLGDTSLREVALTTPSLDALKPTQEEVIPALRTWPGSRNYRIHGVARDTSDTAPEKQITFPLRTFADAGATSTTYKVWLPYGTPPPDRNLIRDGIETRSRKPSSGSILDGDVSTVASTQSNKRAKDDWFAVEVAEPVTVKRIVFFHGDTTPNGGWFDTSAGKLRIEIKTSPDSQWQLLRNIDDYPATTETDAAGLKHATRFEINLPEPAQLSGIRIVGKPSCGANPNQNFSTCAELQAFSISD
ncbi:MAG: sulfatase-like hydrolase/transferase [Candidatus Sumerlaeaceae bacterium]